jgi:hypothetical protein
MIGDALIAHELAHVVQQGAARAAVPQSKGRDTDASALEQDADQAALGAVSQLWSGARQQQSAPQQRSGLRLSRCSKPAPKPTLPSQPTQADQKNVCKGSPIRIEVRKPADLSGTFTKSAIKSAESASSGVSFLVPLNATNLTVDEEAECLLTWSCSDGKSGVERETWTHQWSADPPEIAADGQQRTVSDSHSYGMAHRPGSQVRERAEKNGFDMDTCSWEFSENFKGTPVLKAGDKVLHRCVFGNRFEATQEATGKGKPQRSASVTYWGVDQEEVLKGFP